MKLLLCRLGVWHECCENALVFLQEIRIPNRQRLFMINLAVTLFIFGLLAVAVGFSGVGSLALNVGWVLLVAGVIVAIIHAIRGRRVI